ncbi:hypothetical protein TPA0910_49600 [Streptomyces hygroscopicus subsp. sporocinereus]|uniref:Thioesterase domain-containing protein n=1 Tax=Streptomyces hygroscopicus TaxID=1912 RepID=A0ABQ3U4I2_STRHY|nr:hypothetical protein [Streptomyces hygroscopicus]GHJ30527.1 hypothetical protein TPA0910_49600 [Streptomyces hygroscopicus]
MAASNSWRTLKEGADGLVLAIDYPFTGRPEAGFPELAPQLDTDCALWESVPPGMGSETGMTADGYLDRWHADVRTGGLPVRAVFGFCAGSVYAGALADRIAAEQGEAPRVILFDPESPNAVTVYWQFHKVIEGLGVVLRPEEVAEAQQVGQRISDGATDLGRLRDQLLGVFGEWAGVAFDRAGLDEVRRAEFTATVTAFMTYLVAAAGIDTRDGWPGATAISSTTPTNGLNLLPEAERPAKVAREIRFDLAHADLLRSAEVAKTAADLLR